MCKRLRFTPCFAGSIHLWLTRGLKHKITAWHDRSVRLARMSPLMYPNHAAVFTIRSVARWPVSRGKTVLWSTHNSRAISPQSSDRWDRVSTRIQHGHWGEGGGGLLGKIYLHVSKFILRWTFMSHWDLAGARLEPVSTSVKMMNAW